MHAEFGQMIKELLALVGFGFVFIKETMFSEKLDSQSNVRSIREAESQTRALQVFIAQS